MTAIMKLVFIGFSEQKINTKLLILQSCSTIESPIDTMVINMPAMMIESFKFKHTIGHLQAKLHRELF